MSNTGFVEVEGGRLFYEARGAGAPLVLIHSGLIDSRMWDDQIDAFAAHYQVIRYDVRGHGQSSPIVAPYQDTEDLATLLQALGIEKTHMLGLSMGGRIASDFTITYPEKVDKLLLPAASISGYQGDPNDPLYQKSVEIYRLLTEQNDRAAALDLLMQHPMWHLSSPRQQARLREMFEISAFSPWLQGSNVRQLDPPAIGRLHEIDHPTFVLVGDQDTAATLAIADLFANGIAKAEKVVMTGAAHLPNMEKPDEFNALILEFLQR